MRANSSAKVPNVTEDVNQSLENFRKHSQQLTDDVHGALNKGLLTLSENLPMQSFSLQLNGGDSRELKGNKLFAGGVVISNSNPEASVTLNLREGKLNLSSDSSTSVKVVAFYSEGL